MIGIAFGTLSAAEALEAAGIDKAHAKAIAVAIRNGRGDLATRADINELWTEIASIRSELAIIRWVIGIQKEKKGRPAARSPGTASMAPAPPWPLGPPYPGSCRSIT